MPSYNYADSPKGGRSLLQPRRLSTRSYDESFSFRHPAASAKGRECHFAKSSREEHAIISLALSRVFTVRPDCHTRPGTSATNTIVVPPPPSPQHQRPHNHPQHHSQYTSVIRSRISSFLPTAAVAAITATSRFMKRGQSVTKFSCCCVRSRFSCILGLR